MSSASTTVLEYPPVAHTGPSKVVSQQPVKASSMSAKSPPSEETQQARRLKGGCIPCPDGGCCYIIPIPCCCC